MIMAKTVSPPALPPGIVGLTADSREVRPGYLFAALPGTRADGRRYIPEAMANGAVAILAPTGTALPPFATGVTLITDDVPRRRFAQLAAAFFGTQPRIIAAVTGTNGKTSTAHFSRQIWERCGHVSASLGTLGVTAPGFDRSGALTTPDPVALHGQLADLAAAGVTHLAMEASSHGLDQYRLDGVAVGIAAFTNLSRDHLDYHGSLSAYWAAKRRLFSDILVAGGTTVFNADTPQAADLAEIGASRGQRLLSFGRAGRDIRVERSVPLLHGTALSLSVRSQSFEVELPLVGAFQAQNAVCALGIAVASGIEPEQAVEALTALRGVRGRLELVARHPNGAPVFVDYAHTPEALETVLTALRPHVGGRLVAVFGCGGDRDRGKRPVMGATVRRLADHAIVTDDNPRGEPPAAIRAAALAAIPEAEEIGDRAEAIRAAVRGLHPGDILVIAGKGHEQGQIVGDEIRPFDDAEEAVRAVAELEGGGP